MVTTDIRGLMPGISPDDNTGLVLQNIYEGLVAWRADGTVAPMLAKEITTSEDKRTYTFTLRDGVTFHNGAPLTSSEVSWTWARFLDPKPVGRAAPISTVHGRSRSSRSKRHRRCR